MARELSDPTLGLVEYRKSIQGMLAMVFVLQEMPLERIQLTQATAIAHVKVTDPLRWARVGKQMEDDAILTDELVKALREIEKQIPELRRTTPACTSQSPPSSDPINSPRKVEET